MRPRRGSIGLLPDETGLPKRVPCPAVAVASKRADERAPSYPRSSAWPALRVSPRCAAWPQPESPVHRLTNPAANSGRASKSAGWQGARSMTSTQDLGWLLANFADRVPGVAHAVAVSADGPPGLVADLPRNRPTRRRSPRVGEPDPGRVPLLRGWGRTPDRRGDGQRLPVPHVHLRRLVVRRARRAGVRRRAGRLRDGTAGRSGRRRIDAGTATRGVHVELSGTR